MSTNYYTFKKKCDELLSDTYIYPVKEFENTNTFLPTNQDIRNLLTNILQNSSLLADIASSSYAHKNGFDKIVLIDSKCPQYNIRLHIWWPQTQVDAHENIHSHPWHFNSRILTGSYRYSEYVESETGKEFYEYAYNPPLDTNSSKLNFISKTELKKVFDCLMKSGTEYSVERKLLHQVQSTRNLVTSSLVTQGADVHYPSRVFFETPFVENDIDVPANRYTPIQLNNILKTYLDFLHG